MCDVVQHVVRSIVPSVNDNGFSRDETEEQQPTHADAAQSPDSADKTPAVVAFEERDADRDLPSALACRASSFFSESADAAVSGSLVSGDSSAAFERRRRGRGCSTTGSANSGAE